MCLEPGSRRNGVGDAPFGKVSPTQQPVEPVVWCVCEVCGLRIHPVHVKRSDSSGGYGRYGNYGVIKTVYI